MSMEMSLWKDTYQLWLLTISTPRHIHGLVSVWFGLGWIEAREDRRSHNLPGKSSPSPNMYRFHRDVASACMARKVSSTLSSCLL